MNRSRPMLLGLSGLVAAVSLAACGGGPSAHIEGKVQSVIALDSSEVRIFTRWTNTGKASGSGDNCIYNTTVYNEFGDNVNVEVNSTSTNGTMKPGASRVIYQDIGVNAGDARFIKPKDVSIVDC